MKTTLTRESPSRIRLAVEATADDVAPALQRAVRKLGNEAKIPGFRKGKVPRQILETRLGREALKEAIIQEAVPELLARAVQEETLAPLAPPSVDVSDYELDADLRFDATVEVRPEFELPNFELLSAKRPNTTPTDEEVDAQLGNLAERFASLETVQRPARTGDYALIDIQGTLHEQPVEGLSGTDQLYEVGSSFPLPELDKELEGKSTGDIIKFNAVVPESLGIEQAGQEMTFQVLVKDVRQKNVPAIDDDFAKMASEFDTLQELRDDIAARLEKLKAAQADAEVRSALLEQLVDETDVEPPPSLVHEEMAYRIRRLDEQLRSNGLTLEKYMEMQNLSEEQLESDLRTQAERNVKAQLILDEIARVESFTTTEEEFREEVRYHAETLRVEAQELEKQLSDRGRVASLVSDIIRRKALNHLVEKAEISREDAPAGAEEGENS